MTKIKTCGWLDANIRGGLNLLDNKIYPCCGISKPLYDEDNLDYTNISVDELQQRRKELQKLINEGKACAGCEHIVEKEENEINIDKINYLSIGLFNTCNLRCKYCYFSDEQLGTPINPEKTKLLPVVKKFAEANMLKETIGIGIAGGEPALFEDLTETLNYIAHKYKKPECSFISNASIKNRAEKLSKEFPKIDNNIYIRLYTSVDAGTGTTYKEIRGKDLFYQVCNNLVNYAKTNSFEEIILKYILLFDHSNTKDSDIFGFLELLKQVKLYQKGKTTLTIDCDMLSKIKVLDDEMIRAAGILHYCATNILNIDIVYCGGALVTTTVIGRENISKIEDFSKIYQKMEKSEKEIWYLQKLRSGLEQHTKPKKSFFEKFLLVYCTGNHFVVRILGIKIKFHERRFKWVFPKK